MKERGRKRDIMADIFARVRQLHPRGPLIFDNDLVKAVTGKTFSNQFDATKFDRSEVLPQVLRDEDYFVVHLGQGKHQFVKGIKSGIMNWRQLSLGRYKDGNTDLRSSTELGRANLQHCQ